MIFMTETPSLPISGKIRVIESREIVRFGIRSAARRDHQSRCFASSKRLRERNTFTREDGTPLQYTLVNIKDWCKNDYEVINQLRMNTDNSHHRYDVILLINGIPVVQVELKAYDVSPRRAMQQIVDYKTIRETATRSPCFVSYSYSLSATRLIHIISQIITTSISRSMPTNNSFRCISTRRNEIRK